MKYWTSIFLLFLLVASCDYFKPPKEPKAIARVGKSYLYESDILNLVPNGTSKEDSITIVKSFIDRWATQKLLFEAAEKNIGKDQVEAFNDLIEQYKVDLYTEAYLENLVIRQVDTLVTESQIQDYYNKNKQYFKNPSELVKLRYINLVKENPKFAKIKSKFTSFTKKDKKELEQMAVQFKSYAFNDSIWVDINQVYEKIPFINIDNKQHYISSGSNFQYPDSTTIWLVKVNSVLPKDSATPLEFLKPTIKQIIINNRKLELINTLEKEITNDAIKDNKYEIYK
ncbi:hypothetical protein NAT47_05255 [Flavobacterium sp. HXWNR69]|uniref:Peptidyl-prolyl cis-trans isomerase n=1 Tax=Flavobacterium fragile TaxID=2949085 RepID=A0ABT0TG68_9FLAO|nr:hypothetical protein [Flavobacterium sp. HXWNR69]MCL9769818.1 hypothetical protein [Flavobacterium sp. HXWNR69]